MHALPICPRPYPQEAAHSWLTRVGRVYSLNAERLIGILGLVPFQPGSRRYISLPVEAALDGPSLKQLSIGDPVASIAPGGDATRPGRLDLNAQRCLHGLRPMLGRGPVSGTRPSSTSRVATVVAHFLLCPSCSAAPLPNERSQGFGFRPSCNRTDRRSLWMQ
jgi:hypothetical protein